MVPLASSQVALLCTVKFVVSRLSLYAKFTLLVGGQIVRKRFEIGAHRAIPQTVTAELAFRTIVLSAFGLVDRTNCPVS